MESQPQNPEFRINPESFHHGINYKSEATSLSQDLISESV